MPDNDFSSNPFLHELSCALFVVESAGIVCRNVQRQITPGVLKKKDRSPVTIADFASQAVICHLLDQTFPDDPIIGEEDASALQHPENSELVESIAEQIETVGISGMSSEEICQWIDRGSHKKTTERFWTLDPIDGTKGFLRGEQYAISLALIVNGAVTVSAVACPNLPMGSLPAGNLSAGGLSAGNVSSEESANGTIFFAARGAGCWAASCQFSNEISDEEIPIPPVRVRVTSTTDSATAKFCESVESGHTSHTISSQVAKSLGIVEPSVRLDSQAKYAVVARGEADIYMRLPTRPDYHEKIWDHAGGALLVEEAGGTVTDITGRPLEWNHGDELRANRGVIATNGLLHQAVLESLAKTELR